VQRYRYGDVEVVALSLEGRVRAYGDYQVEIARRTTGEAGTTLAGDAYP